MGKKQFVAEAAATTSVPLAEASQAIMDANNYPTWVKGAHDVVVDGYPALDGLLTWKVS